MSKGTLIDNHYFDWKDMPCGKRIIGDTSKRALFVRLHRKKCFICSKFSFKELMYITPEPVSNDKMTYIEYKKGAYNTTQEYVLKL